MVGGGSVSDTGAIAQIGRARQFLAEAKDLTDIKAVRDMAEAARLYARAAGLGQDAMNEAAEVKLRAERKAGEALVLRDRPPTGPTPELGSSSEPNSRPPTLDELGITKKQSMNWQTEASVPEPVFEEHIAETKAAGEPLTTAGIVRLARPVPEDEPTTDIDGEEYIPLPFDLAARQIVNEAPSDVLIATPAEEATMRAMAEAEHILKEPDEERAFYMVGKQRVWMRLAPNVVAETSRHPDQDAPEWEAFAGWCSQVAEALRRRSSQPFRVIG